MRGEGWAPAPGELPKWARWKSGHLHLLGLPFPVCGQGGPAEACRECLLRVEAVLAGDYGGRQPAEWAHALAARSWGAEAADFSSQISRLAGCREMLVLVKRSRLHPPSAVLVEGGPRAAMRAIRSHGLAAVAALVLGRGPDGTPYAAAYRIGWVRDK